MIQLRDYQLEAVRATLAAICEGSRAPLIAMPGGTGKALTLAGLIQAVSVDYPYTRHMVLSHKKEILEQDYAAIKALWPSAPVGVYSAGIGCRDTMQPIIVGGCASVRNCVEKFGHRDIVYIDECHLVSPEEGTTYQLIIQTLASINPNLVVVGLSATIFRTGIGCLTNGGTFDTIAIDLTSSECWKWFIANGYLSPIYPKRTAARIDTTGIDIVDGDFSKDQLQRASGKDGLNAAIAAEIAAAFEGRRAALVFCAGIENAEEMADELCRLGVRTRAVHSKLPGKDKERDALIDALRNGKLDCLTNNDVMTTGVDIPIIDLIGMARATVSVSLWVQMVVRGSRAVYAHGYDKNTLEGRLAAIQAGGKRDCIVLDFAGNRKRLGPIDAPYVPDPRKREKTGEIPVKVCDNCGCYAHITERVCEACGQPFPIQTKLKREAGTDAIMSTDVPVIESFNVNRVTYVRHERKLDGAMSIRVTYMCGAKHYSTWINFETSKSKHFAHEFWRQFVGDDMPETNEDALKMLSKGVAVTPKRVRVWVNKQYPEITGYEM